LHARHSSYIWLLNSTRVLANLQLVAAFAGFDGVAGDVSELPGVGGNVGVRRHRARLARGGHLQRIGRERVASRGDGVAGALGLRIVRAVTPPDGSVARQDGRLAVP
jgi:hypothetical protein